MDIDITKKITLINKALAKLKHAGILSNFINKWKIPINDVSKIEEWKISIQESKTKHKKYQKELLELALKSGWPREDMETFEDNIILSNVYVFNHERIKVKMLLNETTKEKELYLRIFGNTTKDDIRSPKLWKIISEYKKQLPNYSKRNYPDKNNPLRQKELDMSLKMKTKDIQESLNKEIEKNEEKHPEVESLYDKTTITQISKDIYKQKNYLKSN